MKYIVTTWETLESKYEVEAEGKDDAWKRVLDNEGEQVAKNWLDNGSYIVELETPANPGKSSGPTGPETKFPCRKKSALPVSHAV